MLCAVSEVASHVVKKPLDSDVLPERDANPFYHWDGFDKTASPKKLVEKVDRVSPKKRRLEEAALPQALLVTISKVESVLEEVPLTPSRSNTSKSLTVLSWDSEEDLPSPSVENKLPHKLQYVEGDDFHLILIGNKQLK